MCKIPEKEERIWALWFTSVPGIGRKTLYRLEGRFGSLKRAAGATEEELSQVMKASQIRSLREFTPTPDGLLRQCERAGVRYVTGSGSGRPGTAPAPGGREEAAGRDCDGGAGLCFPERLRQIPDPPYGLFVKGVLPDPDRPTVAIIGARACSGYGRECARLMGAVAAAAGIQVISGMARGVDSISQSACLEAGGTSFAVLGSGADVCYPAEARPLYERLAGEGGVISEYPLGVQPVAGNFPPRNRLISGLADLVLVIEARERSGTLITVDMALEQGREVAVLPGRITDALSQGCCRLYEQGAHLVTSPQRMAELVWESFNVKRERGRSPVKSGRVSQNHGEADTGEKPHSAAEKRYARDEENAEGTLQEVARRRNEGENQGAETQASGVEKQPGRAAEKSGAGIAADAGERPRGRTEEPGGHFSQLEYSVWNLLDLTPQPAEQLYRLFQENGGKEDLPELLTVLMDLELAGECESVGGMYAKKEREPRKTGTCELQTEDN
ncbi:MAG: DNA-processing protein DprA [Lachnospiraceae bacterium]|nr:DNA-processing protein DprA [Lachnospiraceae bacterium]